MLLLDLCLEFGFEFFGELDGDHAHGVNNALDVYSTFGDHFSWKTDSIQGYCPNDAVEVLPQRGPAMATRSLTAGEPSSDRPICNRCRGRPTSWEMASVWR